jgi:hypothetical protein
VRWDVPPPHEHLCSCAAPWAPPLICVSTQYCVSMITHLGSGIFCRLIVIAKIGATRAKIDKFSLHLLGQSIPSVPIICWRLTLLLVCITDARVSTVVVRIAIDLLIIFAGLRLVHRTGRVRVVVISMVGERIDGTHALHSVRELVVGVGAFVLRVDAIIIGIGIDFFCLFAGLQTVRHRDGVGLIVVISAVGERIDRTHVLHSVRELVVGVGAFVLRVEAIIVGIGIDLLCLFAGLQMVRRSGLIVVISTVGKCIDSA